MVKELHQLHMLAFETLNVNNHYLLLVKEAGRNIVINFRSEKPNSPQDAFISLIRF